MPELTIASYNIHWGHLPKRRGGGPFDVVEACRRLDADVLVLLESWAPDDGAADHQRVAEALGMAVACDVSLARSVVDLAVRTVGRPRLASHDSPPAGGHHAVDGPAPHVHVADERCWHAGGWKCATQTSRREVSAVLEVRQVGSADVERRSIDVDLEGQDGAICVIEPQVREPFDAGRSHRQS